MQVRRGDIWWASLHDDKVRPVVVLTSNQMLDRLTRVTVVAITTTVRPVATQVVLTPEEHGVAQRSAVNCHEVATIDKGTLHEGIASLNQETMNAIVEALHIALDLEW